MQDGPGLPGSLLTYASRKADARFAFGSADPSVQTYTAARQEDGATCAEYLPYSPFNAQKKDAASSWTPSKPKMTKTGAFSSISCCCNRLGVLAAAFPTSGPEFISSYGGASPDSRLG